MFRILAFFMFPFLVIGGIIVLLIIFFFMSSNNRARRQAGGDPNKTSYSTGSASRRYSAYGGRRARTKPRSGQGGSGGSDDVIEVPILEVTDIPKDDSNSSS